MNESSYALYSTLNNKKIISELIDRNSKVFLIPEIETEKIDLNDNKKKLIQNLLEFDWLVFTDVLTVDYFIENLEENEIDLFDLDSVRICSFGEAVSDRLRFSSIHSDIIPTSLVTGKIFDSIKDYLSPDDFAELHFLVLKETSNFIQLTDQLKNAQTEVVEIPLYKISENQTAEISKLKALLAGGAIDEIVFSDPMDLIAFQKYFNEKLSSDIQFSVTNEAMYQMLFEFGYKLKFFDQK